MCFYRLYNIILFIRDIVLEYSDITHMLFTVVVIMKYCQIDVNHF
jgi:hypothetical protein